jgi:hypothetical protein
MTKFKKKPARLIKALAGIDFYFLNLIELKTALYNATLNFEKQEKRDARLTQ